MSEELVPSTPGGAEPTAKGLTDQQLQAIQLLSWAGALGW
jgi:hypothetical protein